MNTVEEPTSELTFTPPSPERNRTAILIAAVWRRRRWVAKVVLIVMAVTVGLAFLLMPNQYKSTAQLMPPDPQSLKSSSALDALTGNVYGFGASEGLFSQVDPAQTTIGILTSTTSLDDIINRFDLRRVYRKRYYFDTRKRLLEKTTISANRESGLITIDVEDKDRQRAQQIAGAYIEEVNKLLSTVSSSEARRERLFLEARLASAKKDLDATSLQLSQFSSRNATLSPDTEGVALIEAASKLQAESIAAESELKGLQEVYTSNNTRLKSAQARVDELHRQLKKLGGETTSVTASLDSDQLYPSIRALPVLGLTYYDLKRQLTTQETVYALLTRQYELAKIQEAKEIPSVKVLDQPNYPEKKDSPHRSLIMLFAGGVAFWFAIAWIGLNTWWENASPDDPGRAFVSQLRRSIQHGDASSQSASQVERT